MTWESSAVLQIVPQLPRVACHAEGGRQGHEWVCGRGKLEHLECLDLKGEGWIVELKSVRGFHCNAQRPAKTHHRLDGYDPASRLRASQHLQEGYRAQAGAQWVRMQ